MSKKVFLHVGEPKCGTTFVQNVLWNNRTYLAEHGLLVPGLSAQDHFRAAQDLRAAPQRDDDPGGSWRGAWDILAAQARMSERDVVISHELLAGAPTDRARLALDSFGDAEVHVVLSVRDMGSLLPAEWQETVKHRNTRAWGHWLTSIVESAGEGAGRVKWFWAAHDTLDVLDRWAAGVPTNQVHLVTMPPPGAPRHLLWERFAGVLGLPADVAAGADLSQTRVNASLGLAEVEVLRQLNGRIKGELPEWFYAQHVKEVLAHDVLAAASQRSKRPRLELPVQRREWATRYAETLVKEIDARGYDVAGDLDELRPRFGPVRGVRPGHVTDRELLDAALEGLRGLLNDQYRTMYDTTSERGVVATLLASVNARRAVNNFAARHPAARRAQALAWQAVAVVRRRSSARRSR